MGCNDPANPLAARFEAHAAGTVHWSGLCGSSVALALVAAASRHPGLVLAVLRSNHQAQLLEQDIRLFKEDGLEVLYFPDHETLPYDPFSPHPDIVAERLATLSALNSARRGVLLVSVTTLMQRLPPRSHALARNIRLEVGQPLAIDAFRRRLQQGGYSHADTVYQAGQFAVRGAVIDLFPSGSPHPVRIDLFDEEIESLREFDVESQRSVRTLREFVMLPAREYPCDKAAFDAFRKAFRYRFAVDTRNVALYQDLRHGAHPQGLEQYLPLFFEQTESLFDYLPRPPLLFLPGDVAEAAGGFWTSTRERWEQRRHDVQRPVMDPSELFFSDTEVLDQLGRFSSVRLLPPGRQNRDAKRFATQPAPDLHIHERGNEPAAALLQFMRTFEGRVLFAADTAGRREVLAQTLQAFSIKAERFDNWPGSRLPTPPPASR